MADRRRINPPLGGTSAPIFESSDKSTSPQTRTRDANTHRKIFLQTGIVPSASGSAYLELQSLDQTPSQIKPASLKLICTIHGPRPLPRNTPFSSTLVLSTHLKYAPFATKTRKGYIRDSHERDLGSHLETALRGVIIAERWPKAAVEVIVTVLESEDDGQVTGGVAGLEGMTVLAGAITAASAALVDAGIDCLDLISGGVAAVAEKGKDVLIHPCQSEHAAISSMCVVGYLQARDEITELWTKGSPAVGSSALIDRAVEAASLSRSVLADTVREFTAHKLAT